MSIPKYLKKAHFFTLYNLKFLAISFLLSFFIQVSVLRILTLKYRLVVVEEILSLDLDYFEKREESPVYQGCYSWEPYEILYPPT